MIGGGRPLQRENLADTPLQNADFQSIFARSASTVTPGQKSSLSTRAVELGFKKPKNPNLGFLGFLILLFYFNSF